MPVDNQSGIGNNAVFQKSKRATLKAVASMTKPKASTKSSSKDRPDEETKKFWLQMDRKIRDQEVAGFPGKVVLYLKVQFYPVSVKEGVLMEDTITYLFSMIMEMQVSE